MVMVKARTEIRSNSKTTLVLVWDYDKCTERMESAFARLSRRTVREGAGRVILDMKKCDYINVAGMNALLEWYIDLARDGVEVRLRGLKPILRNLFVLSRIEWLLAD